MGSLATCKNGHKLYKEQGEIQELLFPELGPQFDQDDLEFFFTLEPKQF